MTKHLDALTLNAWADGLLAPEEFQRVAAHLAKCGRCQARAAGQAQMAHLLLRLPPEAPPPLLARDIVTAVARQRRRPRVWAPLAAAPPVISAAAALAGLVLVVVALPDLVRLLPAIMGLAAPAASLTALLDVPADTLAGLASSTFDWASLLTGGAGVALLTGLVLLTGAAFGGLVQLLRPGPLGQH